MSKYLTKGDMSDLQNLWGYLVVRSDPPGRADAIVVGGAALMTDMAQHAAQLYHEGRSSRIIVSGYVAPDVNMEASEAELLRRVLLANGVPEDAIFTDEEAANTGQNITHTADILRQSGVQAQKIILVHKPFMTRRFLATAEVQWPQPQPEFYIPCIDMSVCDYFRMHHQAYPDDPGRIVRSMLGEYERIKTYPGRGFIAKQSTSELAERAYKKLINQGFEAR